ncbi:sulfatase family protein [Planctomycetes bacterium K23_9]|uniref:Arylsulfatase n=1 Tax=Stieleria marina TaxID=1930275 RepID=A0A517NQ11_9BACT|nr:Arylsulfatase [Planctomycetes bacterium K23_9]
MRITTFLLFATCLTIASADDPLPNIVLMMADDMGMGDTSAYQNITGNSDQWQIHTPSMERLARMGMRFTDAHTPTSRCTGTRYGLMTGRYPWRNRLKHFVLFGAQGDPMIERDRPTIATLLKDSGYSTGMVGKWHIGLRYRRSDGKPAAGWEDADLTQPIFDGPTDHGFDYCRFTSRSHGTSGVSPGNKKAKNDPNQSVGPGHIHGRIVVSATGDGKRLKQPSDPDAYVLDKLGSRHSDHSIQFMTQCVTGESQPKPFFLYYASNSNHSPYTPDDQIGGQAVSGAARNVAGKPMAAWKNKKSKKPSPKTDLRHDFIFENDVVLGRMIDYLQRTDDPRRPGHTLIENTIVIFTSDNGAERNADYATGPFRSNKGSAYEGGHRVPLMVAWPAGQVGDGNDQTPGRSSDQLTGLQDMFATFSDVLGKPLPDLRRGQKGGEDSTSMLAAWRGETIQRGPLFHNDHNEAKDKAAMAMRIDNPVVDGAVVPGKWKLFCDATLIRSGNIEPTELYDLIADPQEQNNVVNDASRKPLAEQLASTAALHRHCGGHRMVSLANHASVTLAWADAYQDDDSISLAAGTQSAPTAFFSVDLSHNGPPVTMNLTAFRRETKLEKATFDVNSRGLGIVGGKVAQVDYREAIVLTFSKDVLIQSVAIVAGNGQAGGFYQVGDKAPLAIYCTDDDIDFNDQSGVISDIGVVKAGETLRLDSSPHYGVEAPGRWRLGALTLRQLD